MTSEPFRHQIELISSYTRALGDLVGLNDCTCNECNEKKREISLILGEYGAEYATTLTIAVLQEGVSVRSLERKIDILLAAAGDHPSINHMHGSEYKQ